MTEETKLSSSQEISTLFDMESVQNCFFCLHQEFGAAFQVTKNVVLLTNLGQKLNFGFQKTAHANLAKLHLSNRLYIEQFICHLLMLLLSVRFCSMIAKRNSVCSEAVRF